ETHSTASLARLQLSTMAHTFLDPGPSSGAASTIVAMVADDAVGVLGAVRSPDTLSEDSPGSEPPFLLTARSSLGSDRASRAALSSRTSSLGRPPVPGLVRPSRRLRSAGPATSPGGRPAPDGLPAGSRWRHPRSSPS